MRIDAERPRQRNRETRAANRAHVKSFLHAVKRDADVDTIAPPRDAHHARPYIFGQE